MEGVLSELYKIIMDRIERRPQGSYTAQLASKGAAYVARKFGEESLEVIIAAIAESKDRLVSEIADALYHLLVLMALKGVTLDDVEKELRRRMK
uniref:Phosphoribosyl-ATP pyrophosphatase n=1 Tax=Ignisphaera aggregans TaxID=334771 RepID=A0A7C2V9W4_9CREN